MHYLNLVLYKAVNGGRIYATSEFEMYYVQYVRVDLSSDKVSKELNI